MRSYSYGFPAAELAPNSEQLVEVKTSLFRPQKLVMTGTMREIRGHFKIKRARLPLLDREDVTAYTRVYRCRRGSKVWFRRGRTTVEYKKNEKSIVKGFLYKTFTRTYLPENVDYIPVDALEYIALKQVKCDREDMLRNDDVGISARFFAPDQFGNALPFPTSRESLSLLLRNMGDIPVRVQAAVIGYAP